MRVDAAYTYTAKTCDTESHWKLLYTYGFKSVLLEWIKVFLNDRTQCAMMSLRIYQSPVDYLKDLFLAFIVSVILL